MKGSRRGRLKRKKNRGRKLRKRQPSREGTRSFTRGLHQRRCRKI